MTCPGHVRDMSCRWRLLLSRLSESARDALASDAAEWGFGPGRRGLAPQWSAGEAALLERHAADGSHLALAAVALLLGRSPSYLRRRWQRQQMSSPSM